MKRIFALMIIALLLSLAACQSRGGSTSTLPTDGTTMPPSTTEPSVTEPISSYVEVSREGEISQIPVNIVRGTVGDYTIAMDPEYFTFSARETVDLFLYEGWEGSQTVGYSVSDYQDDADPQEFIDSVIVQFGALYESYTVEETAIGDYKTTAVCFNYLKEDPTYQMQVFLVNCQGNYYLIEATFTMEMYEGLYAIMRALFDTFSPVTATP